ncbi:restriction endonuclease [Rhodanobacter sp. Col0626]|uniref:restriction endonuclease n=1 Tax=Rhodanobacter sp. Col0626 TaxID=3415679 RepID=UPI003CFAECD5
MAKRKQSGIDVVASMPWPVGVLMGLIGYLVIRYGIGAYFTSTHSLYLSGLGKLASEGVYAPLGWVLLVGCWIAALASFLGRRSRRKLLDKQTGVDSLRQISWRQFEQLTGEAFRRQGYAVEETGLGGADGGIDLILRKDGKTTLVQCKQWQSWQVGVKVVREMLGVLVHERADAVKIVALGDYTSDARRFAQGKPIELIHGGELIATVRSLQKTRARDTSPLDTPLAFGGSLVASLLVIAALSSSTAPQPIVPTSIFVQAPDRPELRPMPRPALARTSLTQPTIHVSESQNDAEMREWKKQNAESMKILEKTTKEMPLR